MSVCLLLIDDGRENYLDRALSETVGIGESSVVIQDADHKLGFSGAVQQGWSAALETGCRYVFHLETDFTFNQPPPVQRMVSLLERYPHLAQVALKRQPCNPEENRAGGIVECHPEDFTEKSDGTFVWTEHRRFFTTNPSVYSTRLCEMGWPQEPHSEGVFTHRLLADPLLRFAFFGGKFDPPMVTHHGVRCGVGY